MSRIFVVALSLLFTIPSAFACSIARDWTLEKEFESSNHVFRGLAVRIEAIKPTDNAFAGQMGFDLRYVRVFYEIQEVLKGDPPADGFAMTWNAYTGGCGVPIIAGLPYVFFTAPIAKDAEKEVAGAIGTLSLSGTQQISQNPDLTDELMDPFRALR